MRRLQRRDLRARGFSPGRSPKSTCLGAFLVLLLNLLILSGPAYANGVLDSVLPPVKTTPAVGDGAAAAQTGTSAVQSVVAPVTKALPQTVKQTVTPVTETGSKEVHTVAAPPSSAVAQGAGTVATSVLGATAQTVHTTATPVLETAAKTVHATAAPVVETAGKSVSEVAAPVLKTAAPVLDTTEQTIVKAAAPVLDTTGQTLIRAAEPVLQTVTHTTTAGEALSNPPGTPTQGPSSVSRYPVATNATPPVAMPFASTAPSRLMPVQGTPRAILRAPQGISASAKELRVESASTLLARLARLARGVTVAGSLSALIASSIGEALRRAVRPPAASSVPPVPVPRPVPGGASPAVASTSGIAFSIFLTLAGLLSMGGLAAMRLLRLASEPRREAPFVLIPERPG
jgi:hypothetical protein